MRKENLVGGLITTIIIIAVILILLFTGASEKDIDVSVIDINYVNEQFFVNISMKDNQDKTGWISDTFLETIEGNSISLTGAGVAYKIEPGQTIELTLWSAEVQVSITNSPLYLIYTAFPSGNIYTIEI